MFDEDVRYTISLKIPDIIDNQTIIVHEDNLEEYGALDKIIFR